MLRPVLRPLTRSVIQSIYGVDVGSSPITTVPMVAPFYGYSRTDVTSISPSIKVAPTDNDAPKLLLLSAIDTTAVGIRTLSSNPFIPYQDLEYSWLITYADDSPIEDLEGVIDDSHDASAANPYTDQISGEGTFVVREAGDYKVVMTARGQNGTSNAVVETTEYLFTVNKPTAAREFYDTVGGNNTNDGLDPHGFALADAVYAHATRTLNKTAAFTAYTHDVSMNFTNRDDYIHISSATGGIAAGTYRIESKTDNDNIVLAAHVGLTADATLVVSSDGAKQTFSGLVSSDKHIMLKGGQTHTIASQPNFDGKTGNVGIVTYGAGRATLAASVTFGLPYLINMQSGASGSLPDKSLISNVILDGNANNIPVVIQNTSTADSGIRTILLDNNNYINGNSDRAVKIGSLDTYPRQQLWAVYGGLLDTTAGIQAKRMGLFADCGTGAWSRLFNVTLNVDSDNPALDHYFYPFGVITHLHVAYCNFLGGNGSGYCINANPSSGTEANAVSVNNNLASGNADWFIDMSNSSNDSASTGGSNIVVANNKSNVAKGLAFYYNGKNIFFKNNDQWNTQGNAQHAFKQADDGGSVYTASDFIAVLEGNRVYGQSLCEYIYGSSRELSNNINHLPADNFCINYNLSLMGGRDFIAEGNNLYAPLRTGDLIATNNGTGETIATFNTSTGGTNASTDPNWNDPVNGDFSQAPVAQELTLNGVDGYITISPFINIGGSSADWFEWEAADTDSYYISSQSGGNPNIYINSGTNELTVRPWTGDRPRFTIPAGVFDGLYHTFRVEVTAGGLWTLSVDGGAAVADIDGFTNTNDCRVEDVGRWSVGADYMSGSPKNLKFSKDGVITEYNIDSGSITTDSADVGTGTMTYNNVIAGDWS